MIWVGCGPRSMSTSVDFWLGSPPKYINQSDFGWDRPQSMSTGVDFWL
ncbi:hypothetical protein [Lactobacillus equicursoris]|nr:hypothetical protein [Lactobacillus equicursoris]MDD6387144.1 hypothetical protein [Lactobacillus equicursoris]